MSFNVVQLCHHPAIACNKRPVVSCLLLTPAAFVVHQPPGGCHTLVKYHLLEKQAAVNSFLFFHILFRLLHQGNRDSV